MNKSSPPCFCVKTKKGKRESPRARLLPLTSSPATPPLAWGVFSGIYQKSCVRQSGTEEHSEVCTSRSRRLGGLTVNMMKVKGTRGSSMAGHWDPGNRVG